MPDFRELLKRVKAGESLETLLPLFKSAARPYAQPDMSTLLERAADKDFSTDDSFADVQAARIAGDITQEQYDAIRAAVLGP